MELKIIKATVDDTARISALENIAFSDPWSDNMIRQTLENGMTDAYLALNCKDELIGYAFLSVVADESELENIAVHPEYRRCGVAKALTDHIIEIAREKNALIMYLEVRESNEAAHRLYESAGFEDIAFRPNYYRNPTENAIIMRKFIDENESSEEKQ